MIRFAFKALASMFHSCVIAEHLLHPGRVLMGKFCVLSSQLVLCGVHVLLCRFLLLGIDIHLNGTIVVAHARPTAAFDCRIGSDLLETQAF